MNKDPKLIKQYKVVLKRVDHFDSITGEYPENLGLRTKLGGFPTWIQNNETPLCKSCKQKMSFVAQIDSLEHSSDKNPNSFKTDSLEQEYMFGDVGMIYVFFCYDCLTTETVFQCY